jgi:ATP-dependent Clp protease ATP-binding subunit ClpB
MMLNLRSIPTKPTQYTFLSEVDFVKLAILIKDGTSLVRPAGRESEIEEMRLSLMSAATNSVWLMGDEGVGKTTIISGLLQKIANREVGPSLLSRRFFIFGSHSFFKLPAANQFADFDACMEFMKKQPSILIFDRIDDFIDTSSEANFYANALIDSLVDTTQAIIVSQLKSRDKIHEASTGFAPTFVEQIVKSPNKDGLLFMLRANRLRLQHEHDVLIPEETIRESARILARYPGRAFTAPWPQGPLDLLDKTAAHVRMSCYNLSPDIMAKSEQLLQLKDELDSIKTSARPAEKRVAEIEAEIVSLQAIVVPAKQAWEAKYKPYTDTLTEIAENEAKVVEINARPLGPNDEISASNVKERSGIMSLLKALEKRSVEFADKLHAERAVVSRADIQNVFASASGMTLTDISGDERARLLNAEQELAKTVFGQDSSLSATANLLRDARSGVSDPDRPSGIIMYTGPTGVGKTELSKALSVVDGGEGSKPITFPMNKFKDQSAVSEFRGPAPGLIGYSDEGPPRLREVRRKPRSIILFDEIEKANAELFDVIMTITDEGTMDDSASNEVSFKDGILIFTTNVVLPEDVEAYLAEHPEERSTDPDAQLTILRNAVKAKINPKTITAANPKGLPFFKPEFVDRIDQIVMFDYLSADAAKSILHKQITNQNRTLETKNYRLEITDEVVVDAVTAKFFKKGGNGRTVRQYYNRLIRPQITAYLLRDTTPPHENDDTKVIQVMFDGENITIGQMKQEMKEAA